MVGWFRGREQIGSALLRTSLRTARPAALALTVNLAPRSPPSFLPRLLAAQEPQAYERPVDMLDALNLPFTARSGTTRALARTMAKSFSARFRH
jgi:hypothetical protein